MSDNSVAAGQAAAGAIYALVFAPLANALGTIGGLLVDGAAQSCAQAPNDGLAQQFAQALSAAENQPRQ